ncbi:MAG TPA: purine-nucleoside phosphorylase [Anaerolineales bacterium]|nr:purine-nucleoside phosphorylase [Anaerolineales bacterium]
MSSEGAAVEVTGVSNNGYLMTEFFTLAQIDQIADLIRKRISSPPKIALILGSGLGSLAEAVADAALIPYQELPSWPASTVQGHQGRLVIGQLEGRQVMIMQGRAHYYEGYSIAQIGLPVRVSQRLGARTLIVTNAAGAVNPDYTPGDLMLITDHLNLIGMAGLNPLRGPNLDTLGPRFPDMSQAYDRQLGDLARQVAQENDIRLQEGVYVCLAGPSFETPADLRFLRSAGVDAVGMSTVPEVTVARHGGQRTLGVSGISNKANLDGNTITTHEEVLQAGEIIVPKLATLLKGVLRRLPAE